MELNMHRGEQRSRCVCPFGFIQVSLKKVEAGVIMNAAHVPVGTSFLGGQVVKAAGAAAPGHPAR